MIVGILRIFNGKNEKVAIIEHAGLKITHTHSKGKGTAVARLFIEL